MRITIHVDGDCNDAEVLPEIVSQLTADGSMWPSRSTGDQYGEEVSLPIYAANRWPSVPCGFRYIQGQSEVPMAAETIPA